MLITTEELANFDTCPRLYTFAYFQPPRVSLAAALNDSLRVGLLTGDPAAAKNHLMQLAADPGLAISVVDIYGCAVHHAALIEIIVHYLLNGEGAWHPAPTVTIGANQFQPLSYLMPDQRLRRVVLCSKWDDQRRLEEAHSWRTLSDCAAIGRPMLINAIVIGSTNKGWRPSAWTKAYSHPVSRELRIQPKNKTGESFNDNWRRVYREHTSKSCTDWLGLMQTDNAFEGIVQSITVDMPTHEVHEQMKELLTTMSTMVSPGEMRRAACFKNVSCTYSGLCYSKDHPTPSELGWLRKPSLV